MQMLIFESIISYEQAHKFAETYIFGNIESSGWGQK